MEEMVILNREEQGKLMVLNRVEAGKMGGREVTEIAGLSLRHINRLLKAVLSVT